MRYINKVAILELLFKLSFWIIQSIRVPQTKRSSGYFTDMWEKVKKLNDESFLNEINDLTGVKISKEIYEFIDNLALKTQISDKESEINWQHGYLLYAIVCNVGEINKNLNILEIGTAKGFSSICMAKALSDLNINGKIITFDIINHLNKMYWNTMGDEQKRSRQILLQDYDKLISDYIVFLNGTSRFLLKTFFMGRIDIAFLDGSHEYKDVLNEFLEVNKHLSPKGVIVFDDYTYKFPGVIEVVEKIEREYSYNKNILSSSSERSYAILEKK